MFSTLPRFNWWFGFKAQRGNGEWIDITPHDAKNRSFFQRNVEDFKVAKFHLNIYSDQKARSAYAQFLCRTYRDEKPYAIQIELYHQYILEASEARKLNKHLDSTVNVKMLDYFICY